MWYKCHYYDKKLLKNNLRRQITKRLIFNSWSYKNYIIATYVINLATI